MRPAFRYYGGKGRLAPWIVSLLPEHVSYVEPFFGAGAVLLGKPQSRHEIVNDLDGAVVNFYRVLRTELDALVEALRLTPHARDEFQFCKQQRSFGPAEPVEMARQFFTVVSQSFACTTGSASGWSASTKSNVNRARSNQYYVDRLAAIAERLQLVMIENTDAATVIDKYAHSDSVVYLDPPYVHATRHDGAAGGHGYAHEMTDEDHRRLAAAARSTKATVLLSGYQSELYDELYEGWERVERKTYSTVAGIVGSDKDYLRTEVLWSNQPIGGQGKLFEAAP